MLDRNLLRSHLYNTYVLPLLIEQNDIIHDIEVEVHQEIFNITKTLTHSESNRSPFRSSYKPPYGRDSRHRYRSRSDSRDKNFTRYISSFRPPSRPTDSRFSRSRSHSITRNKPNTIQP